MPNADDDTTAEVSENTPTKAEKESPRGGNAIRQARIREQFAKRNKNIK